MSPTGSQHMAVFAVGYIVSFQSATDGIFLSFLAQMELESNSVKHLVHRANNQGPGQWRI